MFGSMFNVADGIALIVVLVELLLGLRRGLSGECGRCLATAIALTGGLRFYLPVAGLLTHKTHTAMSVAAAESLAFIMIVLCIGAFFLLLRLALRFLVTIKFNDGIDRPGGALAGILRGICFVIMLVFALGLWPNEAMREYLRVQSVVGRTIFRYADPVVAALRAVRFDAPQLHLQLPLQEQPAQAPETEKP